MHNLHNRIGVGIEDMRFQSAIFGLVVESSVVDESNYH
jgi:hypothetical protein